MRLEEMLGQEFLFYGVNHLKFKLNDDIWEVIEDANQGYHAYLKTIKIHRDNGVFFREPIAIVVLYKDNQEYTNGYRLEDVELGNHVWLRFGNNIEDRDYPLLYFTYTPNKPRPATRMKTRDHEIDQYDHLFNQRES